MEDAAESLKESRKNSPKPDRKQQALVFGLTFVAYAMFHVVRKSLSSSKKKLETDLDLSVQFLGLLDTLFLVFYSVGLFTFGHMVDRTNPKLLLVGASAGTAVTAALFGAAQFFGIDSEVFFACMWSLNGLFQSLGWPCCVSIMGNWVGRDSRGRTFGIWAANISFGNIAGLLVGTLCFQIGADWSLVFLGPAAFLGFWALLLGALLRPEPDKQQRLLGEWRSSDLKTDLHSSSGVVAGSPMLPSPPSQRKRHLQQFPPSESPKNISWFQVWLLPGVIAYTLANVFLRFVSYAVFFWLPLYISEALNQSVGIADLMSSLFDAGGAAGGVLLGIVSDFVTRQGGTKSMVIMPTLFAAVPAFYVYSFVSGGVIYWNCIMTAVCGMLVNGAYNLLVSSIPADIGAMSQLQGNKSTTASVIGILDGVGGLGSAFAGICVAWVSKSWGWGAVFYMLMCASFVSGIMLLQIWIQDAMRCRQHRKFGYTKVLR